MRHVTIRVMVSLLALLTVAALAAAVAPAEALADLPATSTMPWNSRVSAPGDLVQETHMADDGGRLVYVSRTRGIFSARLDNGKRKQLWDNYETFIEVSGDGEWVTFREFRNQTFGKVDLIRANGANRSVSSDFVRMVPGFSITNSGYAVLDYPTGIVVMDQSGTERSWGEGRLFERSASPFDDRFITWEYEQGSATVFLDVGDARDLSRAPLAELPIPEANYFPEAEVHWLPGGSKVLLEMDFVSGHRYYVRGWLVDLDTGSTRMVGYADNVVSISPDGSRALITDVNDLGYVAFLDKEKMAKPLSNVETPVEWAVADDWEVIVGKDRHDKPKVFNRNGVRLTTLSQGDAQKIAIVGDRLAFHARVDGVSGIYTEPLDGSGPPRLVSATPDTRSIGGHDGWVYWSQQSDKGQALYRARPDGKERMRLSRWADLVQFSACEVCDGVFVHPDGDRLFYSVAGDLWQLDLDAIPERACFGLPATLIGTGASETLVGTAGDDVIVALGGDDIVKGRGGNDRMCLGNGNDRGVGDGGDDFISGGNGDDELIGKEGNDKLLDNKGTNSAVGGPGTDVCRVTGSVTSCEKP